MKAPAMSGAKEPKLKEVVEHHLPHEIAMLFGLFMRFSEGIPDIHLHNAAMESFCIHARNLIEFLERRERRQGQGRDLRL